MTLTWKRLGIGVFVVLGLGALFAFFGVYNTDNLPFYKRYVFWTSTMATGTAANIIVVPWVVNHLLRGRGLALQLPVIAALISLPVLVVIALFDADGAKLWTLKILALQYVYVIAVSLVLVVGGYVCLKAVGWIGEAPGPCAPAVTPPTQKFLERLPIQYRGAKLYAISSEDHYLRVHTDRGEELILMRLTDAMRELNGAEGLQIHRSWWVAHEGVAEVKRDNGRQTLLLKSGAMAPVSRSFSSAVKEAGFSAY